MTRLFFCFNLEGPDSIIADVWHTQGKTHTLNEHTQISI